MAWPPATYDVISRNHSNWPSLNFSQDVCEGWTNRSGTDVLSARKNLTGGVASTPPPPPTLYVRGLKFWPFASCQLTLSRPSFLSSFWEAIFLIELSARISRHCTKGSRAPGSLYLWNIWAFHKKFKTLVCCGSIGRCSNKDSPSHLYLVSLAVRWLLC